MSRPTGVDTPTLARPAVSLLHRDPPRHPTGFTPRQRGLLITIGAAVLVLAGLAAWDGGRVLLTVDEPVAEWVAAHRTPAWTEVFNGASRLGDNIVVFALAAVLGLITFTHCRYLAGALLLAAFFRPAVEFVLKAGIDRARPDIDPLGTFAGPSHPSGHPLAAASLWGLVPAFVAVHVRGRLIWWTSWVVAATVIVAVAAARVYKGAHWLSDVGASLLWAALYLSAVQGVFDRWHHTRDCRHPQHLTQHPEEAR